MGFRNKCGILHIAAAKKARLAGLRVQRTFPSTLGLLSCGLGLPK